MPRESSTPSDETMQEDDLLLALRQHQQKTTRLHLKRQQAVLAQAQQLAKEYGEAVGKASAAGGEARRKRVEEYHAENARLAKEIKATEIALLELLQAEAETPEQSEVQLAAAAVKKEMEERDEALSAGTDGLGSIAADEAKGIEKALEGLWDPVEEGPPGAGQGAGAGGGAAGQ
ncbi:hypothetical protein JCM8097_006201 [Rhodosporidiobolus ruineniae]